MKVRDFRKQDRLCLQFILGYKCEEYAHQCITQFQGDGIVVLLGHLFKIHRREVPRGFHMAPSGEMHLLDIDDSLYTFQKVGNGIMLLCVDGPKKENTVYLERKTAKAISALESFKITEPQNALIRDLFSKMALPT